MTENVRGSDHEMPLRQSLFQSLKEEVVVEDELDAHLLELKRERVSNFLSLPFAMERLMYFGYLICLDSFLHTITMVPLRFLHSLFAGMFSFGGQRSTHVLNIVKFSLLINSCLMLQSVDAATLYHSVRGQSVFKLYVIFNVLEIGDKLCSAFGLDVLDSLFAKILSSHLPPAHGGTVGSVERGGGGSSKEEMASFKLGLKMHYLLALAYIVAHAMVLFYQCITLHAAINSYSQALLTLLVSNQFAEIKSNVFKRYFLPNSWLLNAGRVIDIVERFQLSVFLFIITTRNLIELSGKQQITAVPDAWFPLLPTTTVILDKVVSPVVLVFAWEVMVDWLKHAFIVKFNHLRPTVFRRFEQVLSRDLISGIRASPPYTPSPTNSLSTPSTPSTSSIDAASGRKVRKVFVDQSPVVARRIGFSSFPLTCLMVRICIQTLQILSVWDTSYSHDGGDVSSQGGDGGGGINQHPGKVEISLVIIKMFLGIHLFKYAKRRYAEMIKRQQDWEEKQKEDDHLYRATDSRQVEKMYVDQIKKDLGKDRRDSVLNGEFDKAAVTLDSIDRFTLFKSRIP